MKIRKRFLSAILVLCMFFSMTLSALAAESTFVINGVTVSPSSGVSLKNCSAYASQVLKKIWDYKGVTTTFNSSYNMLKDKTSSEREITEDHVREFIQNAPLGSRIRISHYSDTSTDNYDNNINGHTMVLVAKDDNAGTFTTLEAGGGSAAAKSYSYSSFAQYWRNFKNRNGVVGYCYFFYIADLTPFGTSIPQCTITFDPEGGSVYPTTKTIPVGAVLTGLPTPTRSGYTFIGWATKKTGSSAIVSDGNFSFEQDTTLYAKWRSTCTNHTYDAEICTTCGAELSYDNGFDASTSGTYKVTANTAYVRTGPYQSKDLVKTMNSGETVEATGSVINSYGNVWLKTTEGYYVHAEKMSLLTIGNDKYTVILDDGSACTRITVTNGSTYGILPAPQREGYTFDGWYTNASGGTQITASTTVNLTGDQTLYAHWTKNTTNTVGPWSDWSRTPVMPTSTREVETRQVRVPDGHTEYRYGRYVDSTGKHDCWCAKYLEGLSYVSGSAILQYSSWSTTQYSANSKGWSCGYCSGNHTGVDHYGTDGRAWWAEYVLPNGSYYWEETQWVDTSYNVTEYRYRDLLF